MADTKISALTATSPALSTHRIPIAISPFGAGDNGYLTPTTLATFANLTAWTNSSDTTLGAAVKIIGTTTNTVEFQFNALTTGVVNCFSVANNTAATGGATVQNSPPIRLRGTAWTGSVSQTVDFQQHVVTGSAATPTGLWTLSSSINGGALSDKITVGSNGATQGITFANTTLVTIAASGSVLSFANGAGTIRFTGTNGLIQYNLTFLNPVSTGAISLRNLNANATMTSGTHSEIGIGSGWAPASGTAVYNMVVATQTINNAGNGVASLFNIAPTWTATGGDAYFLNYAPTVTSITGVHYAFRATSGNVLIGGTTLTTSAILDLQSTTRAFIPPRMTGTQRDNIASPSAGMVIYNTSTNKLNVYTTAWEAVTSA